jgi:hypothetical protein
VALTFLHIDTAIIIGDEDEDDNHHHHNHKQGPDNADQQRNGDMPERVKDCDKRDRNSEESLAQATVDFTAPSHEDTCHAATSVQNNDMGSFSPVVAPVILTALSREDTYHAREEDAESLLYYASQAERREGDAEAHPGPLASVQNDKAGSPSPVAAPIVLAAPVAPSACVPLSVVGDKEAGWSQGMSNSSLSRRGNANTCT